MLKLVRRVSQNPKPIGDLPASISAILCNRGIDTPEKAEAFLNPDISRLHDPFLMNGMDKAVRLIRAAVAAGSRIVVYGDYDVDGICATSIMLETLRDMGADPDFRIPSRHGEGYGLNCDAIRELAADHKLLITVDCGVTNLEEVALANQLGMTVIVTDHHQPADTLPPADAILNPLLGNDPYPRYGRLCGAGVALKLTQALLGMDGVMRRIDLAALATVADIVPLVDENRIIVREGLQQMDNSSRPGLLALLKVSGTTPPLTSTDLGFRLGPRLNAAGRLEDASQGVLLLTAPDMETAEPIACHLDENNQTRKGIEQEMVDTAMAAIRSGETVNFRTDKVIIIMGDNWNKGVIGLAAGRICNKYHYPAIVLANHNGEAVGSCRSIPGVNIHQMLTLCKDLFIRFGGHEQAAGLTMRADLVPELRRRLNLVIAENCVPECFIPVGEYDTELRMEEITLELVEQLKVLEPTGCCNPPPVFLTRGAQVQECRRIGAEKNHLRLVVSGGNAIRTCIGFQMGDRADEATAVIDLLFEPQRNEYNGRVSTQLSLKELTSTDGSSVSCTP